jgi:hypothetical protein
MKTVGLPIVESVTAAVKRQAVVGAGGAKCIPSSKRLWMRS